MKEDPFVLLRVKKVLEAVLKWFQKFIVWYFRDSFDFERRNIAVTM